MIAGANPSPVSSSALPVELGEHDDAAPVGRRAIRFEVRREDAPNVGAVAEGQVDPLAPGSRVDDLADLLLGPVGLADDVDPLPAQLEQRAVARRQQGQAHPTGEHVTRQRALGPDHHGPAIEGLVVVPDDAVDVELEQAVEDLAVLRPEDRVPGHRPQRQVAR